MGIFGKKIKDAHIGNGSIVHLNIHTITLDLLKGGIRNGMGVEIGFWFRVLMKCLTCVLIEKKSFDDFLRDPWLMIFATLFLQLFIENGESRHADLIVVNIGHFIMQGAFQYLLHQLFGQVILPLIDRLSRHYWKKEKQREYIIVERRKLFASYIA